MKKIISCAVILLGFSAPLKSQSYLSNLHAGKDDPVYTVYAAPLGRSSYKLDQGYRLEWFDPSRSVEFASSDGGNLSIGFRMDGKLRRRLSEYYAEPVITASYSDLVKFYLYPFKDVRVEETFAVYDSQTAVNCIILKNESGRNLSFDIIPYFYLDSGLHKTFYDKENNSFVFEHNKKRDGWMKDHNIPYAENLKSVYMFSDTPDNYGSYEDVEKNTAENSSGLFGQSDSVYFCSSLQSRNTEVIAFLKHVELKPGESKEFRQVRRLDYAQTDGAAVIRESKKMMNLDLGRLIKDDEKIYSRIPEISFRNEDEKMLYWNAFSLIRQCMMKPEGESKYNYYVFSREPKWGWGYGGQVFHESLVMLAYAYMDPEGAMNSQRVYFERQHPDGYINYRTGPYLNESIEYRGQFTSSAPWFNYENYEIYKITKDKIFLSEAYEAGKRFYNFFVSNRDTNKNGLCAWGGEAELESVRDARVAVWDKVGWASNFEGPDLNSMLVAETSALSVMAVLLGKSGEAAMWKEETGRRKNLINKYLWDPETQFYYNVNKQDQTFTFKNKNDLKIKEVIGFLPMWANVASKEQAAALMKSFLNENEFRRKNGVPSLSAADDYYNPIGYWNGPVWIQWQYLVFRGLINYGYEAEARELAAKVLDSVIRQLKTDHYFWEFYSADDDQAGWNKAYIWTGIVSRFMIDLNYLK